MTSHDMRNEGADLLVWNAAECIVWIFTLQIYDKLRKFMVMPEEIDRVLYSSVSTIQCKNGLMSDT